MAMPSTQVAEQADAIRAAMQRTVDAAANDPTLSLEGKRQTAAKAYQDAQSAMADLRGNSDGGASYTADTLQRDLFGAQSVNGADAISQRDAMDRAAQITDPTEARALLQRCQWSGDDVLSRAVAQVAFDRAQTPVLGMPWNEVVNDYASTRPEVSQRLQDLADAKRYDLGTAVASSFTFAVPKPSLLGSMNDVAIGKAASDGAQQ